MALALACAAAPDVEPVPTAPVAETPDPPRAGRRAGRGGRHEGGGQEAATCCCGWVDDGLQLHHGLMATDDCDDVEGTGYLGKCLVDGTCEGWDDARCCCVPDDGGITFPTGCGDACPEGALFPGRCS